MKISIITVVYNDETRIAKTIESVINQTYKNIEYVIVDGKSTDNTINILNKYQSKISRIISEVDEGIYDAMNKGLKVSTGDRVLFLNAGDELYDKHIISSIINFLKGKEKYALVYGNVLLKGRNLILKSKPIKNINKVMVTNHQACFFDTKIHKNYYYNLNYKIAADYEVIFKMFNNNEKFAIIDSIISKVEPNGVADSNRFLTNFEYFRVRRGSVNWMMNFALLIVNYLLIFLSYIFNFFRDKDKE
jgi:glycosyltransferase involved in cell wall biosynthesis